MASLPSFVELMASLGLEQSTTAPAREEPSSPKPPSSPSSPRLGSSLASSRSSSSPSIREIASRHRVSRFSPYSPAVSVSRRRGSWSSVSSSSDFESSPLSATFHIPPHPASSRLRRYRNKLTINTYDSSSDINANTPISTYVRRKTPGTSPTSPTFNLSDSGYESSSPTPPMPFSIPSLPVLLPHSASSESFPDTPASDSSMAEDLPHVSSTGISNIVDNAEGVDYYRFIRRRTGTRISAPPRPNPVNKRHSRKKQIVDLAS
ncbi:hypothetical protein CPB84DRAFT_1758410 [Gymnopilus junonius]|uniref:Uncharacterized protein n=1 Tax=Gymnopilus junonius TaxID=109634 RepID=A0A9P5TVX4_GYMJU|nr:hypothetical protein CPB84DRAFT_1758410 [Gymnopilus junonius]